MMKGLSIFGISTAKLEFDSGSLLLPFPSEQQELR